MRSLAFASLLLLGACASSEAYPQRSFQWLPTLGAVGLPDLSDEEKNAAVRQFAGRLIERYGASFLSSVTVRSPSRFDFKPIFREFADRAAIPFEEKHANLLFRYELDRTGGAMTGPHTRNYQMNLTVIRPDSLFGGDQIVAIRTVRLRCNTDLRDEAPGSCATYVPLVAEGLLYDLARSYAP